MYKVFVQFGIAGLAGIGSAFVLGRIKNKILANGFVLLATLILLFEYTIVPPALSVNLTHNPEIYQRIKELPKNSILIETPLFRNNKNSYQGYVYYQTIHEKKLFNPTAYLDLLQYVPVHIKPFYRQMYVPLEAGEYCNLSVLRYLGINYLTYHWFIGTKTVIFRSFEAPDLVEGNIDGLKRIYRCNYDPREYTSPSPYDYTFADLYEIVADPCPIALTFDYNSPYKPIEGILKNDVLLPYGWASALVDTSRTFSYPLNENLHLIRLLHQGGRVTVTNMSDKPVDFSLSFDAKAEEKSHELQVKWNGNNLPSQFIVGMEPIRCEISPLRLEAKKTGELTLWSPDKEFLYEVDLGIGKKVKLPALAVVSDFRVIIKNSEE